jgi:hypothetical protein
MLDQMKPAVVAHLPTGSCPPLGERLRTRFMKTLRSQGQRSRDPPLWARGGGHGDGGAGDPVTGLQNTGSGAARPCPARPSSSSG